MVKKMNLEKFIFLSTAFVSGDYQGKIFEDQIDYGQKFHNHYEASKYQAEKYIRENLKKYLIFRPSVILGDVYQGKAVGCTFGYYRFMYMFFLFKL
jgi:thioester reductase-like protein